MILLINGEPQDGKGLKKNIVWFKLFYKIFCRKKIDAKNVLLNWYMGGTIGNRLGLEVTVLDIMGVIITM